ncbi:hypothetical protein GCM10009122_44250 [Fulvivirga kasyanovii]|uniref:GNAT family N-acetyltransferase n=1 Tax=Fulvivirga kasyanovii TaxID=396812 RepID=A0ABW9RR94_9BACT|nr:hypothetical protein [Fulvivirga kasyanovii]MTI26693.1 hypothetical protein [Fulvivirga kasyanovii]
MIGANVNGIKVEDLFQCYDKYNFLYQEKKEKMRYLYPMIKANWSMALDMPWENFLLLTYNRPEKDLFASVSAWRSTSRSYLIQHMVSNQPENTRLILLHFLELLKEDIVENNAIQVFYQPKTRFANNMFSYLEGEAGPLHSHLHTYSFLSYPLKPIRLNDSSIYAEELNASNKEEIQQFVTMERGQFYSWVQDLDSDDFTLSKLDEQYSKYGLSRTRKIVAYKDNKNNILGVTLINKASAGLNFSLLENSTEVILNSKQPIWVLNEALNNMLYHLSNEYMKSDVNQIPLLINPEYEELVNAYGGSTMRTYNYFTCDNTVLDKWCLYLVNELKAVHEHLLIKNEQSKVS